MTAKKKQSKNKPVKPLKIDLNDKTPWIIPPVWYEVLIWLVVIIICFVTFYYI